MIQLTSWFCVHCYKLRQNIKHCFVFHIRICVFQEFLRDRSKVQQLVELFDPVVRVFDGIAGERVSMRVT